MFISLTEVSLSIRQTSRLSHAISNGNIANLSVCLSLCPSVTFRCQIKTA